MWYECLGKRGSSEIGSCLLLFIQHYIQNGIKKFSFYPDNCSGQNRNKFLFSLYNFVSQKYSIKIRHTYLEKGHTQSEGDSVHSVIERAARPIPIYTPDQWSTVVRTAKKKQPLYIVNELNQENIFDLKELQVQSTMNWDRDEENEKVYWNKIKIIEVSHCLPNILLFKESYNKDTPFKKINLTKKDGNQLRLTFRICN